MQPSAYMDTVTSTLIGLVEGTRPDQLTEPTPCSKWTVRDLINHVVGGGRVFAAAFRRDPITPGAHGEALPDMLGDDPAGALRAAVADVEHAVSAPGALDGTIELPFGTMPAEMAYDIAACDLLLHCWDLSRATGQRFDPPADLVEAADGFLHPVLGHAPRGPETFDQPIDVPAQASALDRLVAFTGRQP